jgi:SAM-dependent methyltransferase
MLELVQDLPAGTRVLDLGAGSGSFKAAPRGVYLVRADIDTPLTRRSGEYVRADAASLPFRPRTFDLIISNHSLEHFLEPETALAEIGRVLRPGGAFYLAVPDASTLTDRIYRWLGRGGGHLNAFRSAAEVIALVERATTLPHRATRDLFSSLSFLNAHNFVSRPPRKIALFAFGNETFLAAFTWFLRLVDRLAGTRLSQYGWSFYFGNIDLPSRLEPWPNVCVRCGSGHSVDFLRKTGTIPASPGIFQRYWCPACGAANRLFALRPDRNLLTQQPRRRLGEVRQNDARSRTRD